MGTYAFVARDTTGKRVEGHLQAESESDVITRLRSQGRFVISVKPVSAGEGQGLRIQLRRRPKVGLKHLSTMSLQLATMLEAGSPLLSGLSVLARQNEKARFHPVLENLAELVASGVSFSDALRQHPGAFPPLFINLVEAGEQSGNLVGVLERFASFADRQLKTRSAVSSALMYPIILLVLGLAVIVFMVTFVVPKFTEILQDTNVPLPKSTQILVSVSHGVAAHWPVILSLAVLTIFTIVQASRTERGRWVVDRLKVQLPVLRAYFRSMLLARLTRTMAMLTASGLSILRNLELTANVLGHRPLAAWMKEISSNVARGELLSRQLAGNPIFPPMMVHLTEVGERSGSLDKVFERLADHFEEEANRRLETLTTLLEPLVLVLMAGLVGFVAVSLVMAIMRVLNSLGG